MSYQVLARKWRPQTFADVVGQEHVLTALANGLSLGRIHHAYLFSGTRGVGKTSIARLLAKGLNCETGITATPCGTCANCQEIEQGRFVDLIEIDAASRTKVEDTRELLDNVQYAPARGRFKVYLIDEVHMLSRHSFNALLKTLEEPPAHVKFLLATTDPQKLPVTILSRCLQFHLKALDVEQIRAQLEKVLLAEQITSDARALQLLARAADGSMRDALSLTDQAVSMGQGQVTTVTVSQMLGTLDDEQPLAIIEALVSADGARVMAQIEQAASRGVDWENLLVESLSLLHKIAMVQLLPSMLDNHYAAIEPRLRELARTLPPADIQLYYQTLLVGRKELAYAPDRRMGVEMTLLRALAFHPKAIIAEPQIAHVAAPSAIADNAVPTSQGGQHRQEPASVPPSSHQEAPPLGAVASSVQLPESTAQLLQARTQLLRQSGTTTTKKNEPAAPGKARPANSALERLASVTERSQQRLAAKTTEEKKPAKKEAYRWTAKNQPEVAAE
ncbi:DNA polymerase III subunit gamma/tau, partial [Yersinia pestis]